MQLVHDPVLTQILLQSNRACRRSLPTPHHLADVDR